jgi:hypothetical protein
MASGESATVNIMFRSTSIKQSEITTVLESTKRLEGLLLAKKCKVEIP